MRINKEKVNIQYSDTKKFFANRANKYQDDNPYSVTMYQDNNPNLVKQRNEKEISFLLPKLQLSDNSKILDIACGIGRWGDAISNEIQKYVGIDFSKELINIAKNRNTRSNFYFYEGSAINLEDVVRKNENDVLFNIILMIGLQIYLNDIDLSNLFEQVCHLSSEHTIICLREPIAIKERLTLKEFYSEELKENYNAIYRTYSEHKKYYDDYFIKNGFMIVEEGFLFTETQMNNRKETEQYYWILKR